MREQTLYIPAAGKRFEFRWRKGWWPFSRQLGTGQILALDRPNATVHVRVFWAADSTRVAIGHIPIGAGALAPCIRRDGGFEPIPESSLCAIGEWRSTDMAGVFSIPLADAIELAWETVGSSDVLIESAYPVRGVTGAFTAVRAIVEGAQREDVAGEGQ